MDRCWSCVKCIEKYGNRNDIHRIYNHTDIAKSSSDTYISRSCPSSFGRGKKVEFILDHSGSELRFSDLVQGAPCDCQDFIGSETMCHKCSHIYSNGGLEGSWEGYMHSPKSPGFHAESQFTDYEDNTTVPVTTDDNEVQKLYVDAFLQNNRLEHMIQIMGYHPHYLESFLKTQHYMLKEEGPLPLDYRHYIAIMAAGRHQCSYLINIHSSEFLMAGGDENWLKGLEYVPQKLRDLYEINKILAHRPWLMNKSHIENLTRGNNNWTVSELMHAIVLLAHFHSLCSFVYGCGINAEIDSTDGHSYSPPSPCRRTSTSNDSKDTKTTDSSPSTTPGSAEVDGGIESLMQRMKRLRGEQQDAVMSQEELQKRFEKVENQSAELPAAAKQPSPKADVLKYVLDPDFTYQDFAKRLSPGEIPTFRAQDYSWEDQGYSLGNRLYSEIGNMLDDKFKVACDLTYHTMGDNTDVDTSLFRRSIWHYIHCMFGIRHDDFDYKEVNHLLERNLKAYIKTVTCYPERVTKKDYDSFMKEFKHSEKVHVNLMVLEARLQAELLYALRAMTKYMT